MCTIRISNEWTTNTHRRENGNLCDFCGMCIFCARDKTPISVAKMWTFVIEKPKKNKIFWVLMWYAHDCKYHIPG